MHAYLNIAIRAARAAGQLLRRSFADVAPIASQLKGKNDYVTEIDRAVENLIIDTIRQTYPDHAIMGEESGQHGSGTEEVQWIIDPLDGTTNFMHGIPHFAISIAVQIQGRISHGLVYDPIKEELFTASRGAGAQLNNRRIRVSDRKRLEGALLATGFPFRRREHMDAWINGFRALMQDCADMRRAGAAALDLAYVAAGRLDGFWEFGLQPWDIAAGSLLVKEAGGIVDDMDGTGKYMASGDIVAASPRVFKDILKKLQHRHQTG